MKYYLDITLLPDSEIGYTFLQAKVYQQLHIAFVAAHNHYGDYRFGVTFPAYGQEPSQRLGRKIRLFAQQESDFTELNLAKCLVNYSDYVHLTSCRPIPDGISQYVRFYRRQFKSSPERLTRRMMKRTNSTYEQACQKLRAFKPQKGELPYIRLKSLSNGETFPLFIDRNVSTNVIKEPHSFSSYGLSKQGWLPQF